VNLLVVMVLQAGYPWFCKCALGETCFQTMENAESSLKTGCIAAKTGVEAAKMAIASPGFVAIATR
jgi:hypothetical protein